MMPIEEAIVDTLQRSGPCGLDDIVAYFPNFSWGEVFLAVDRMSRDGRVSLLQLSYSTYQITLRSQFSLASSTSSQKELGSSLIG